MMRLHEDMDLPQVYIEKDYWVTKALKHLCESTHVNKVVFKGGTSVSQAVFATILNISVYTIQKWESGDKKPTGTAF